MVLISVDCDAIALVYHINLMHVDCDDMVDVIVHFVHNICRGGLLPTLGLREERWHNQSLAVDDGLIFPLKLQTSLSYLRSQGVTVKLLTRGSIYIEQLS